jgi:hypothetical protein
VRTLYYRQDYIRSLVDQYFHYQVDGDHQIDDGGNDMFDGGNKLEISNNFGDLQKMNYGQNYQFNHFDAASVGSSPFHAALWVDNSNGENMQDIAVRVFGDAGADGSGNFDVFEGEMQTGGYQVNYVVYQIYGADGDASIIEVYYAISNEENWGSSDLWESNTGNINDWGSFDFSYNTGYPDSTLKLAANTKRTLTMYTLLSRELGFYSQRISQNAIEHFLREVVAIVVEGVSDAIPPVADDDLTNLHCDQYYGHDDRCHKRKAYMCDYAQWRVNFFAGWLNDFHHFRTQQGNDMNDDFEMPECTLPESEVTCVNPNMKACVPTHVQGCPVCYCRDHEYTNTQGVNLVWQRDYMYWSRWQQRWQEMMRNINGNDFCGLF